MKTKFNGILTLLLVFTVHFAFAQKTVSGTVSDETGPLPAVNVLVQGTQNGTETDFNGKYSLTANEGDVLVFSYVGYEDFTQTVGSSSNYDVMMIGGVALGEVVIAGVAGATSRKKLSVTVNKVSSKDLEDVPSASAASVLQGKVAGVTVTNFGQPGEGASIQLRGATNLFGSQEPLVIVDGVIVEGGLQDINSDDIKSFEIVKGASASALYGSQAGNGVIVITTKTGRRGKVDVTFKSELGFEQLTNFMTTNNSHEYELASDWEDFQGKYTRYAGVTYPVDYDPANYSDVTGGRILSSDHYSDNPFGVTYDPQKEFFRTGTNTSLYTSIASAGEKASVFFSADKTNAEGILKDTKGYERAGVRLNVDYKINSWLKFSARNNFVRINNNTPGGENDIFFNLSLTSPDVNLNAINPDGQPHLLFPSQWSSTTENPLYSLGTNPEKITNNKFLGGYKFNIKFTDWLNLDTEYTIESIDRRFTDYVSTKNLKSGGSLADMYAKYSTGNYSVSDYNSASQKGQITLNFKEQFGDLGVTSKVSYLVEDYDYSRLWAYGYNAVFEGRTTSLDNYNDKLISSNKDNVNARNAFGIIGLDFKDRYLFDAMYRKDGSSAFGSAEQWHDYFRVSGAYRISKDFDIKGVDELKLHAAYGTAGQRPADAGWSRQVRFIENGLLTGASQIGNPNLKPSKTTEFETGLTSRLIDRINFEVVYSQAKTEDQFMKRSVNTALENGEYLWDNQGTVEFNTIEIATDADIFKNSNFKWNSGLVFEKTKSTILSIGDVAERMVGVGGTNNPGMVFRLEEGIPVGTMYGAAFVTTLDEMEAQLPTGASIDDYVVNRDGVVVRGADVGTVLESAIIKKNEDGTEWFGQIGAAAPDFKVGFRNNFSYKNFNLYALVDWKQGGDVYNRQAQWLTRDNRHAMLDQSEFTDGEKKTTDYYQSLYSVNADNSFWVEDASYVKLRETSLFYTFTKDKLSGIAKGFFQSIKVGITGNNLLTFTKYSGWDPEVQLYDDETLQYYPVDYNVYPTNTAYKLSFKLKF